MPDFRVQYPDEASFLAVASLIPGLTTAGALNEGRGVYAPSGALVFEWALSPAFRQSATDASLYRLFRFNGDPALLGGYVTDAGGTMTTDASTGAITITAGPVTMIAPPPAGRRCRFDRARHGSPLSFRATATFHANQGRRLGP